jgi:hypothetical protein
MNGVFLKRSAVATSLPSHHKWLDDGFNHLEKYEFVNGKDYSIYEMEKMFETTRQYMFG